MPRSVAFGDRLGDFGGHMTNSVLIAIDGPTATITLNDPAKHNRLDPAGLKLLREAVEKADADPNVRVTVITGAGEKTFCSGYDLGSIPAGERKDEGGDNTFEVVMDRIEAMRMPTLCALNAASMAAPPTWRWPATSASASRACASSCRRRASVSIIIRAGCAAIRRR
jgi:hypothetical protein